MCNTWMVKSQQFLLEICPCTPVAVDSTDATDISQMNTAEVDDEISIEPDSDLPHCRSTCAVKPPLWLGYSSN